MVLGGSRRLSWEGGFLEIIEAHLSVTRDIKNVVGHASGLPFRLILGLLLMGLVDSVDIELLLLSVQSHIIKLRVLVAIPLLVLALRLDSCDVETLARHDGHILRRKHLIIVIVLVAALILRTHALLFLLAIGLHPHTLSLIARLGMIGLCAKTGHVDHDVIASF